MSSMADTLWAAILVTAIIVGQIIFDGDPDIADGWRCHVLEIPMEECRSPKK